MPSRVNQEGLRLIMAAEGWRAKAYHCAAGVLTIGYGHTSMAGPPEVRPGMTISKKEGEDILRRDIEAFARGVAAAIRAELTGNQFSALVSFAYNVGLGAFRKSSVLRAVNQGEHEMVPRRLQLFVKAGGRTLPGLVKRRAAEAALYMMADGNMLMAAEVPRFRADEIDDMQKMRNLIDLPEGKPLARSSTTWSAIAAGGAGLLAAVKEAVWNVRDFTWGLDLSAHTMFTITLVVVIVVGVGWIIRERRRKAIDEDV